MAPGTRVQNNAYLEVCAGGGHDCPVHPQAPALGRQGEVQEAAAGPELGQPESEVTAVVAPLQLHPYSTLLILSSDQLTSYHL